MREHSRPSHFTRGNHRCAHSLRTAAQASRTAAQGHITMRCRPSPRGVWRPSEPLAHGPPSHPCPPAPIGAHGPWLLAPIGAHGPLPTIAPMAHGPWPMAPIGAHGPWHPAPIGALRPTLHLRAAYKSPPCGCLLIDSTLAEAPEIALEIVVGVGLVARVEAGAARAGESTTRRIRMEV